MVGAGFGLSPGGNTRGRWEKFPGDYVDIRRPDKGSDMQMKAFQR
jgi:hypothetical protein